MSLDNCSGLQESLDSCLSEGTCEDCQHFVGTAPGEVVPDFVPPVPAPATATAVASPDEPVETEDPPPCPGGMVPWEENPDCCVPNTNFIGDGACDPDAPYNIQACGYDGGDCCKGTCNEDSVFGCTLKEGDDLQDYGPFGFYCIDPSQGEAVISSTLCVTDEKYRIGDGRCDLMYNTHECNYDGGDCCEETCDDKFAFYPCGSGVQYVCLDPRSKADLPRPVDGDADPPEPVDDSEDDLANNPFSIIPEPAKDDTSVTICPMDVLECPDGEFVVRNSANKCAFGPCRESPTTTATTTTAATTATATATATTTTTTTVAAAEMSTACKTTLKECLGGEFVGRDQANDCKYFPCPEVTKVQPPKDSHASSFASPKQSKSSKVTQDQPTKSPFASSFLSADLEEGNNTQEADTSKIPEPQPLIAAQISTPKKCEHDLLECSDGTFVERNPKNYCKYWDCPPVEEEEPKESLAASISSSAAQISSVPHRKCKEDFLECSDGTFVERNPNKNCEFLECLPVEEEEPKESLATSISSSAAQVSSFPVVAQHGHCTDELKRCHDGSFVARDPNSKCEWSKCPFDEPLSGSINALSGQLSLASEASDPANGDVFTVASSVHEKYKAQLECSQALFKCEDGHYVWQDPNNECKWLPCEIPRLPERPAADLNAVPCEEDLFTCHDGSFVGRDFNNGCRFFQCPNDDSIVMEARTGQVQSFHDKDNIGD